MLEDHRSGNTLKPMGLIRMFYERARKFIFDVFVFLFFGGRQASNGLLVDFGSTAPISHADNYLSATLKCKGLSKV